MQDQIFNMLMQRDELTWQNIIYDLVKSEEMNPWDIDVSILSKKYLDTIKQLKEHNFFISGKIILASAILLKIKSNKLVEEDLVGLDSLLYPQDDLDMENPEDFLDPKSLRVKEVPSLAIKTPQTRKRKVSINDLMQALNKALEVDQRRIRKRIEEKRVAIPEIPEKKIDITKIIKDIYSKIQMFFKKKEKVTFKTLLPSENKEDKIVTFIPLLHLANQNKITLEQEEHFGDIDIGMFEEIKKE